ncbi:RNA-binding domain-containing protein [Rhodoferax sp.]|uniref:RNA-binding domain-containing protein n=1 Tax=Rhodoferax sp. TaxID=50421 RepID=UPI0025F7316C|nr:RNA-binding domain-containing protein [Rhodoferax sp.]
MCPPGLLRARGHRVSALELLESLNLLDENEHIEAKRASEVGKSILETICAFANEPGLGGGWLLLGVVREDQALFPAYEPPVPGPLPHTDLEPCGAEFIRPGRLKSTPQQARKLCSWKGGRHRPPGKAQHRHRHPMPQQL